MVKWWLISSMFQPTLPHGERPLLLDYLQHAKKFQPTLPHGERRKPIALILDDLMFQPTLPHGERLSPSIYLIFNQIQHGFCEGIYSNFHFD